jgi:hypothetical protein
VKMRRSWEGEPASFYVCARIVAPGSFLLVGSFQMLQDGYFLGFLVRPRIPP